MSYQNIVILWYDNITRLWHYDVLISECYNTIFAGATTHWVRRSCLFVVDVSTNITLDKWRWYEWYGSMWYKSIDGIKDVRTSKIKEYVGVCMQGGAFCWGLNNNASAKSGTTQKSRLRHWPSFCCITYFGHTEYRGPRESTLAHGGDVQAALNFWCGIKLLYFEYRLPYSGQLGQG